MEARASLTTLRQTARKVRLVADLIRRLPVGKALIQLEATTKRAALPVKKVLQSAIANAVNNYGMDADRLTIKTIYVNEGPTLKRMRPRAHGRAYQILKRTSNITIVVSDD